jgi:hypothetical protein
LEVEPRLMVPRKDSGTVQPVFLGAIG